MNLVADESVDQPIVDRLRAEDHSVTAIAELSPSLADDDVLRIADDQAALLLTQDRDFGELVFRLGRASHGVLLIRLHGIAPLDKGRRVAAALASHGVQLYGSFGVLNRRTLRIRAVPKPEG